MLKLAQGPLERSQNASIVLFGKWNFQNANQGFKMILQRAHLSEGRGNAGRSSELEQGLARWSLERDSYRMCKFYIIWQENVGKETFQSLMASNSQGIF